MHFQVIRVHTSSYVSMLEQMSGKAEQAKRCEGMRYMLDIHFDMWTKSKRFKTG